MKLSPNWNHALNMLPHLAKCAKEKRTITYGELGALIGHKPFFLGGPLDILRDNILEVHRLPRIDALVVGQGEGGEAGEMFIKGGKGTLDEESYRNLMEGYRKEVFDYGDWDGVVERLIRHYRG